MLNIYRGRETVDKEKFIYSMIKEVGGRTLVLVPDQYTLVAEKQALSRLDSKVLLDIEILSFSRLGSRLLSECGKDKKTVINRYGRHMLVSKILRDENENLDAFKGMWGRENFVAAVNDFISKAKQYEVSPAEIEEVVAARGLTNATALQRKLRDINFVYGKYEEAIAGKYTDSEDLISMYAEATRESELIAGSNIWIYGFDSFTPKNLSFIEALMERAKSVNVFLTWDVNARDEDLFTLSSKVTGELLKSADDAGSKHFVIDLNEDEKKSYAARERAPGIATLERELFSVGIREEKGEDAYEGVSLVKCASPYAEVEAAASHIRELLREKSYRLSDILVICNDQSERGGIISRVFQEYGLEVFDDKKRKVVNSPIAIYISALLNSMIYGYRAEDVIAALKSGITELTREEIAALEQYAYRLRVRGTTWKKEFTRGSYMRRYRDGGLNAIEEIRKKAIPPLLEFEELYKKSKTYGEFIGEVKAFFEDSLNIEEKMNALSEVQRSVGAPDVAEESEQIWEVIKTIFDQIEEIMGSTPFDGKEFGEILRAGLSQLEIGVLPPSADDMLLGTMQRTRAGDVKSVIIMGANDGILPLKPSDDVLFSKEEMAELEAEGFAFGGDSDVRRMEEDMAMYRCMFKAEEDLWISYSTAGAKGDALQPSEVIATIKKIFTDLKETEDPNLSDDISARLGGDTNTLRRYSEAMRNQKLGQPVDEGWNVVSEWLSDKDNKEGSDNLRTIQENLDFTNAQEDLGKNVMDYMFNDSYSPSELENFSSCPYKHFVSYVLRVEEERVDEVAGREIGDLYHSTLERFAAALTDNNAWDTITNEEADDMIELFANEWAEEYHDKLFKKKGAENYLLNRAISACKFVAWTLVEQARIGDIKESRYEVQFGRYGKSGDGKTVLAPIERTLSDGRKVYIEGRIDRLDIMNSGRVKIIDYKTGNMSLDLDAVRAGYSLQLMLYLEAAREGKKKPAGLFYFLITEPRGSVDAMVKEEAREAFEESLKASYRMDGVLIDDDDVIREIAGEFDGKSSVVKLGRKKDGEFDKSSGKYLISEEDLDGLQEEVRAITSDICEDIMAGRIELRPKKLGTSDPCTYCGYKSICNFDPSFGGCNYEYI
ncbi:MAG: PD-(D/E)XK nuclease family protein [Firmicutes bacterium]|nr:PD-(D/E)XK nuclease family protein [Bacillota bacterium]